MPKGRGISEALVNRTHTIVLPDREIKLSLPVSGPVGCTPDPTGLYWFSDLTGDFTEIAEAAYVLPVSTDPEKPTDTVAATLGIAKVLGETCGAVTWTVTWTPDVENGGPPGWKEDGLELQVYPRHDTAPGVLSVTAKCAGRTFGPMTLTLALLKCDCMPEVLGLCIFTPILS